MWREGNPHALLVGMETGAATMIKNSKQNHYLIQLLLLGIYPKKTRTVIRKDVCMPMFIAALVETTRLWKQPKYPTIDE